jgi:hypothetical protein
MVKKSDVAQALWKTLIRSYGAHASTKVVVPADDVVDILLSVLANVLAGVEAGDRARIQREIGPKLDNLIGSVRQRSNIILPSSPRDNLLLPH